MAARDTIDGIPGHRITIIIIIGSWTFLNYVSFSRIQFRNAYQDILYIFQYKI